MAAVGRADRPGHTDIPGGGVRELLGPLRCVVPMGWTGGRYTTSKPIAATAGSRSAAVLNVPLTGGSPFLTTAPSERGNSSYHEPKRARPRSTSSGAGREELTRSRSGWRERAASTSGASAASSRARAGSVSSRRVSAAASTASRPSRFGTPSAARSYSAAPSARTRAMSCSSAAAGILMFAAWRQVATGSLHASTV